MNNSLKYKKALEWNIPVLKINWIYDCFRQVIYIYIINIKLIFFFKKKNKFFKINTNI